MSVGGIRSLAVFGVSVHPSRMPMQHRPAGDPVDWVQQCEMWTMTPAQTTARMTQRLRPATGVQTAIACSEAHAHLSDPGLVESRWAL